MSRVTQSKILSGATKVFYYHIRFYRTLARLHYPPQFHVDSFDLLDMDLGPLPVLRVRHTALNFLCRILTCN